MRFESRRRSSISQSRSTRSSREVCMLLIGALLAGLFCFLWTVDLSDEPNQRARSLREVAKIPTSKAQATHDKSSSPGWNPINVFYGKMNHLTDSIPERYWLKTSAKHKNGNQWFAQHGQDVAVAKILNFKTNGYFIDLAANDAVWASNTFVLEQNFDWKGICIEANPFYWYRLSFRKCTAVGAIAGGRDLEDVQVALGQAKHTGPYGGIVGKDFDNKKSKEPEHRYTVALQTILKHYNAPKVIDYLSLDVEGAETFIMKDFAWDEYTFLCLTIERPSDELQALLTQHGYERVLDIKRGDTMWAHKSIAAQAKVNLAQNPQEIAAHQVAGYPPIQKAVQTS